MLQSDIDFNDLFLNPLPLSLLSFLNSNSHPIY